MIKHLIQNQKGSVFPLIFGAIALMGLLTFAVFQIVSGPLTGAMNLNNNTLTQSEIFLSSQVAITTAVSQTDSGDCDNDIYIEPLPFDSPGASDAPAGGGFIPIAMGVPLTDVWDTRFGYCVWDVGAVDTDECGGADQNRLQGSPTPTEGNYGSQTVFAFISAGPDKTFSTTCSDFANTATDNITTSGDDIVKQYAYSEAASASMDLWTVSSTTADQIEIGNSINVTGTASFSSIETTGKFIATNGARLYDSTPGTNSCSAASDEGTIRYNSTIGFLQVCDGSAWQSMVDDGAGSAEPTTIADSFETDTAGTCTDEDDVGKVRYNSSDNILQYCSISYQEYALRSNSYVGWRNLAFNDTPYGLDLDQTSLSYTVTGATSPTGTYYSSEQLINVTNLTASTTYTLTPSIDNTTHFEFTTPGSSPCGATLSGGSSCNIGIRAKDTIGNEFSGTFTLSDGVNPPYEVSLYGYGTGFCDVGAEGGGGIWAVCNQDSSDYVIMPSCNSDLDMYEPTCTGDAIGEDKLPFNNSHYEAYIAGTSPATASGLVNTELLADEGFYRFYAAENCIGMTYNGYDDWFLASRDLAVMIGTNGDSDGGDLLIVDDSDNLTSSIHNYNPPAKIYAIRNNNSSVDFDFVQPTDDDLIATRRCIRRHPR